jgi:hypothetical protein
LARYSIHGKSSSSKGYLTLLILPLSIITLFCFGFVITQSGNYKAGQARAASAHQSQAANKTGSLPDAGTASYNKLQTVPQAPAGTGQPASGNQGSTQSKSSKKSVPGLSPTVHDLVNKAN